MTTIHADELQPGDVVVYEGRNRQITRVDRRDGWAWPVAADGTGWAIAVGHHPIVVLRNSIAEAGCPTTRRRARHQSHATAFAS